MSTIIEVKHLVKKYENVTAVNNINFTVEKGSLFAFLGTNGAGKSTTINILCTLLSKTDGQILVDGLSLDSEDKEIRRRIGIVFQENVLDHLLTVKDNLVIRGELQGLGKAELKERLKQVNKQLELTDILNRPFGKLSGGQKRRCEIARALLGNPKILILDEPTTGLDPQTRISIWKTIKELQVKHNMTVFLTTHYMEEAADADKVIIIEKGVIKASGTPDELKNQFGRDKIRMHFYDAKKGMQLLTAMNYNPVKLVDMVSVPVSSSDEALNLLNHFKGQYSDFEVIKGSMDDVFLNVTQRTAEEVNA